MKIYSVIGALLLIAAGSSLDTAEAVAISKQNTKGSIHGYFRHYELLPKSAIKQRHRSKKHHSAPKHDAFVLDITYRGVKMEIELDVHHGLTTENYKATKGHINNHYNGKVRGFPSSIVRLSKTPNSLFEGTISLGSELGTLHLDSLHRYQHKHLFVKKFDNMIIYHAADLLPMKHQHHRHHHLDKRAEKGLDIEKFVSTFHKLAKRAQAQPTLSIEQLLSSVSGAMAGLASITTSAAATSGNENACRVALVADYNFYQHYGENAENYMLQVVSQASAHIEAHFGIAIRPDYVHVTRSVDEPHGLVAITSEPNSVMPQLNAGVQRLPGLPADDMCSIVVFSGVAFGGGGIKGLAPEGTICEPGNNAIAVSDNLGELAEAHFAAIVQHELGHHLGASHDGEGNSCGDNGSGIHYNMSPVVYNDANKHLFSSCSIQDITANLQLDHHRCWMPPGRARSSFVKKTTKNPKIHIG